MKSTKIVEEYNWEKAHSVDESASCGSISNDARALNKGSLIVMVKQ